MSLRTSTSESLNWILRFVDFESLARLFATFDKRIQLLLSTPRVIQFLEFPLKPNVPRSHMKYLLKHLHHIGKLIIPKNAQWSIFTLPLLSSLAPHSLIFQGPDFMHPSTRDMYDKRANGIVPLNSKEEEALLNISSSSCSLLFNRILPNLESLSLQCAPGYLICRRFDDNGKPLDVNLREENEDILKNLPSTLSTLHFTGHGYDYGDSSFGDSWKCIIPCLPSTLTNLQLVSQLSFPIQLLIHHFPLLQTLTIAAHSDTLHESYLTNGMEDIQTSSSINDVQPLNYLTTLKVKANLNLENTRFLLDLIQRFMPSLQILWLRQCVFPTNTDLRKYIPGVYRLRMSIELVQKPETIILPPSLTHLRLHRHHTSLPIFKDWIHPLSQLPQLTTFASRGGGVLDEMAPCWDALPRSLTCLEPGSFNINNVPLLPTTLLHIKVSNNNIALLLEIHQHLPECKIEVIGSVVVQWGLFLKFASSSADLEHFNGGMTVLKLVNTIFHSRLIGEVQFQKLSGSDLNDDSNLSLQSIKTFRQSGHEKIVLNGLWSFGIIEIIPHGRYDIIMPKLESLKIDLGVEQFLYPSWLPRHLTSLNLHSSTLTLSISSFVGLPRTLTSLRLKRKYNYLVDRFSETKQFLILDTPGYQYTSDVLKMCNPEMSEFNGIIHLKLTDRTQMEGQIELFEHHKNFHISLREGEVPTRSTLRREKIAK
jgi:hypothetical protein